MEVKINQRDATRDSITAWLARSGFTDARCHSKLSELRIARSVDVYRAHGISKSPSFHGDSIFRSISRSKFNPRRQKLNHLPGNIPNPANRVFINRKIIEKEIEREKCTRVSNSLSFFFYLCPTDIK